MLRKLTNIRNVVAICLALCMPCQTVLAALCFCSSECGCPDERAEHEECDSQCKPPCCSSTVASPCARVQPQQEPCQCKCHEPPLNGLPLSQQETRSLSKTLQQNASAISIATSSSLDLSHLTGLADSKNTSCLVQQPCILFCRFLL